MEESHLSLDLAGEDMSQKELEMKVQSVVVSLDVEENVAFVKNIEQVMAEQMEQFQFLVVVYLSHRLKLLDTWRQKLLKCLWWYSKSKIHSLINFLCQNVSLNINFMQCTNQQQSLWNIYNRKKTSTGYGTYFHRQRRSNFLRL